MIQTTWMIKMMSIFCTKILLVCQLNVQPMKTCRSHDTMNCMKALYMFRRFQIIASHSMHMSASQDSTKWHPLSADADSGIELQINVNECHCPHIDLNHSTSVVRPLLMISQLNGPLRIVVIRLDVKIKKYWSKWETTKHGAVGFGVIF